MNDIPVALIIASNDIDNLLQTEKENKYIVEALDRYHNNYQLKVISRTFTSKHEFLELIRQHSRKIILIHFAGHFTDGLQMNDDSLGNTIARNDGIVSLLGEETREGCLEFVFLNGCSTKPLVDSLRKEKVPSVIGTNYPVADGKATTFANYFYRKLANADSQNPFDRSLPTNLKEAYEYARAGLELDIPIVKETTNRGFRFSTKVKSTEYLWILDTDNEDWVLPVKLHISNEKEINGPLAIVSCDRTAISQRFEISLDQKKAMPCQFYLLAEQPYGEVDSILKRLVLHMIKTKANARPIGYDSITPVEIDSIENSSQNDIEYFLRKSFNKDFKSSFHVETLQALVDVIPISHPKLSPYEHFHFYFRINMTEKCWNERVKSALKWFITEFANIQPNKYYFYFFFIINIKESKNKSKKGFGFLRSLLGKKEKNNIDSSEIYTSLESFSKDLEQVTVLPPLTKVKRQDIDDWYRLIQNVDNQADRDDKVNDFVSKLKNRTGDDEPWDMSYVELIIEKIIVEKNNLSHGI